MNMFIEYSSTWAIVILILIFIIYVVQAIFLSKFNKLKKGYGTAMGWVPIANIYLLGKLTFNKIVGWILIGLIFSTATLTITINGVENKYKLFPDDINIIVSRLLALLILGLFIYAIIKYIRIKNDRIFK
ncbi:MAG: hypothetical protein HFI86_08355 [Bacilli bacterium]|nr:hypothetical protein [Bacilli bacterium]